MSDWIKWDGSDGGHPEQLDTQVIVRFRDGSTSSRPHTVHWWGGDHIHANWRWSGGGSTCFGLGGADIVAYRVVGNG